MKLLPSGSFAKLDKSYILPGEKMTASASNKLSSTEKQVEIYPATRYGYKAKSYIVELK